ncbi:hypothetical protein C8J56DRAFT_899683 [Mycena floridula]|nr:hypothetical protein C8J56DRAFT_899683 [Mycena floridula]
MSDREPGEMYSQISDKVYFVVMLDLEDVWLGVVRGFSSEFKYSKSGTSHNPTGTVVTVGIFECCLRNAKQGIVILFSHLLSSKIFMAPAYARGYRMCGCGEFEAVYVGI